MSAILDQAEKIYEIDLKRAKEELAEKLREGKKVGGSDVYDILDSELNGERYRIVLGALSHLLLGSREFSRDELAEGLRDSLIERWLDSGHCEMAVSDLAEEIARDE